MSKFESEPILYRFYQASQAEAQLQIVDFGQSFQLFYKRDENPLVQLTDGHHGYLIAGISSDGTKAFFYDDSDGSEKGHIYSVDTETLQRVKLTDGLEPFVTFQISPAKYNSDKVICWYQRGNQTGIIGIDKVREGGNGRELYSTENYLQFPIFSHSGNTIAFIEEKDICNEIVFIRDGSIIHRIVDFNKVFELKCFLNDEEVFLIDGGEAKIFAIEPWTEKSLLKNFESTFLFMDFDSGFLLFAKTQNAHVQLGVYDLESQTIKEIGDSNFHYDYFEEGGYLLKKRVYVRAQSGEVIPEIHELSITDNLLQRTQLGKKRQGMIFVKEVVISRDNGDFLQGWLTFPDESIFNGKVVIVLHGGPYSCVFNEYHLETRFLTDAGFGVFHINYHGSTTFGDSYRDSIHGKPGILESQDCYDVKQWLVGNEFIDADGVYLLGWSWGGFVSLLSAGRFSGEFEKVVSVMGIGDNVSAFFDEHAYLQAFDRKLYGGDPEEKPQVYQNSNPINYAEKVQSKILLIHGKNDYHCPPQQMENYYRALKKLDKEVRIYWTEYGHLEMFSSQDVRGKNEERILDFFQ